MIGLGLQLHFMFKLPLPQQQDIIATLVPILLRKLGGLVVVTHQDTEEIQGAHIAVFCEPVAEGMLIRLGDVPVRELSQGYLSPFDGHS